MFYIYAYSGCPGKSAIKCFCYYKMFIRHSGRTQIQIQNKN